MLSGEQVELLHALFDEAYASANHPYLDKSLARLRFVAIATKHSGEAAGFALGDVRRLALPRLPDLQRVSLGGLGCVAADYRRRGLWGALNRRAHEAAAESPRPGERTLSCGRMAHPASFRGMSRSTTLVPRLNRQPTAWQREVGLAIADIYGSHLDPETFATIGDGEPIGYPRMEIDALHGEWDAFTHVRRERGDALLAISWSPTAPPGWDDEDGAQAPIVE